ncbi:MAG: TraR/DksA C4-type zinc finger protein [Candidatus Pacebacteria bacterium]|nr:TraR/DksA C4-type zinc finger protein [Candidatus Paceibacterota bacterium]MCD8507800.1 TraR/DksA C4-type zinc finger protein [Candidatus Paceibacterota bacterium]MCD8528058.1 TraR/DksA C4-type zinc finger protein [Candidatus Paceibacterota bacterium]MCD8563869.1 TraR/DksA C4-type zinc finger protein [Candidatus Paceibacterota bacterium]
MSLPIEILKEKLLAEKALLEQELNHIGKKMDTESSDWIIGTEGGGDHADIQENADEVIDFQQRIALLEPLEQQYQDVLDALDKIDAGTYGICEKTGDAIPEERLMANPSARTCAHC